jgi:GT2 family glycosyltransferase
MVNQQELTIIFGYRDRDLQRVERCLNTLQQQTWQHFQVIFVDYGSKTQAAKTIVERFSFCRYIYADTRGYAWNRSKALNIGIRLSQTPFVLTSDVDMLFSSDFFSKVAPLMNETTILSAHWHFLPQDFTDWQNVEKYSNFPLSDNAAKGGFQLVATQHIHAIHGFDEFYEFYGVEDEDLSVRLQSLGLAQQWLPFHIYHQWHPSQNFYTTNFMAEGWVEMMNVHFLKHKSQPKRNSEQWGSVISTQERTVFALINPEQESILTTPSHTLEVNLLNMNPMFQLIGWLSSQEVGQSILIKGYVSPHPKRWIYRLLGLSNRLLRWLNQDAQLGYANNRLRLFFTLLVAFETDVVADYYISTENNFAIIIKK